MGLELSAFSLPKRMKSVDRRRTSEIRHRVWTDIPLTPSSISEQNFGVTLKGPDFVGVRTFEDFDNLIISKLNA